MAPGIVQGHLAPSQAAEFSFSDSDLSPPPVPRRSEARLLQNYFRGMPGASGGSGQFIRSTADAAETYRRMKAKGQQSRKSLPCEIKIYEDAEE